MIVTNDFETASQLKYDSCLLISFISLKTDWVLLQAIWVSWKIQLFIFSMSIVNLPFLFCSITTRTLHFFTLESLSEDHLEQIFICLLSELVYEKVSKLDISIAIQTDEFTEHKVYPLRTKANKSNNSMTTIIDRKQLDHKLVKVEIAIIYCYLLVFL